jgi:FAD/FMN-containing dehydrogenase
MTSTTSRLDTTLSDLAGQMRGQLVCRGDVDYDSARTVWNGMHDRHPAAVARCASTCDVLAALRFAIDHELQIAVRGGGHSIPGFSTSDDGMVIDLSPMHGVVVDPAARVAHALWGSKTAYWPLSCGFSCDAGRGAGSIAGLWQCGCCN